MKKELIFIAIVLFLIGFIAAGITTKTIEDKDKKSDNSYSALDTEGDELPENNSIEQESNKPNHNFTEKNRIHSAEEDGTCPNNCTCTGSVVKCILADGTREMTVYAGKSGNIIVQIKGVNVSTNVTLYKSDDGKVYIAKKNNETKEVKLFPEQVKEKIEEKLSRQLENEDITLDENGTYKYDADKKAKLFFIFPVKVAVKAEINSETGKIISIKNSWWAFLAKDEQAGMIVGASCGTVTPEQNDLCCQIKNYDFWNATANECQFN